jgi:hypothetical protein
MRPWWANPWLGMTRERGRREGKILLFSLLCRASHNDKGARAKDLRHAIAALCLCVSRRKERIRGQKRKREEEAGDGWSGIAHKRKQTSSSSSFFFFFFFFFSFSFSFSLCFPFVFLPLFCSVFFAPFYSSSLSLSLFDIKPHAKQSEDKKKASN